MTLDPFQEIDNERGEHDAETTPTRNGSLSRARGPFTPFADPLDSAGLLLPTNSAVHGRKARDPTRRALDRRSPLRIPRRHGPIVAGIRILGKSTVGLVSTRLVPTRLSAQ
jgi:hypothetical protein